MPLVTQDLTGLEALTTGTTFAWFVDAGTTNLVEILQTPIGISRWQNCADYILNYRGGRTPAPSSLSADQHAEAEMVACTTSDALEIFRRLVAAYNRRGPNDTGLFYAYLLSDPNCWDDWLESARGVVQRARRNA